MRLRPSARSAVARAAEGPAGLAITVAAFLFAAPPGCSPDTFTRRQAAPEPRPQPQAQPTQAANSRPNPPTLSPSSVVPPPSATPVRRISLRLEVLRIEVPRGAISSNAPLWKLLDEVAASPAQILTLRENGFRFAVGSESARPALKQALESIVGLRVAIDDGQPRADRPTEIGLYETDHDYSLFYFDDSGHLNGLTFDEARPYLQVRFAVDLDQGTMVRLSIVPEVRERPGPVRYVNTPDGFRPQPEYRGRIFDELAVKSLVSAGGFLLIAGTPELAQMPLLAQPFLTVPDSDPPRENAFIFIPHIDETSSWWTGSDAARGRGASQ